MPISLQQRLIEEYYPREYGWAHRFCFDVGYPETKSLLELASLAYPADETDRREAESEYVLFAVKVHMKCAL